MKSPRTDSVVYCYLANGCKLGTAQAVVVERDCDRHMVHMTSQRHIRLPDIIVEIHREIHRLKMRRCWGK